MKLKKLLCAGLSGALLVGALAGCGTQEPQSTPAPDDVAYQAAGITRDTVLFSVDGTDVTADEYLFWLLSSISTAKQDGYLSDDTAWEEEIDGTATAEYLKQDAMNTSILYTTVANHAREAGFSITEEDEADADEQIAALGEQMEMYYGMTLQEYLDQQCISEAGFRKLNETSYLAADLQEKLEADGELAPDDAKMDAFIEEQGYYRAKHILLAFPTNEDGSDVTDAQKAEVKAEADQLIAQIRAAADPAAEFDKIMNERSDDSRDENGDLYYPDGYLSYPGQMVSEFEDGAMALAVGEISDPIESTFGYHIIMRLDADDEDLREVYPDYAMSKLNEQWVAEAEVKTTDAYEQLDPKAFYDNMMALIEQWQEERAAEEEAAQATATPAAEESAAPSTEPSTEPSATPAAEGE
ncbi:peptidylprolyl isomerase [Flavonifractor hominis]|uniref:Peptidylprolyl isomerase n=1 Tax=Flavonifractor hominis TaxID=3133178 RepID=A0ABV1EQ03_9FIRM